MFYLDKNIKAGLSAPKLEPINRDALPMILEIGTFEKTNQ